MSFGPYDTMIRKHTDWRAMATVAERMIAEEPRGRRVAATVEAARDLRLGVQTLRRFLLANRFLKQLPSDIRHVASSMPAVAVATAARWHDHDPSGAFKAIRDYAAAKYDVRSFVDAEAAARSARRSAVGIRLANAYAREVEHRAGDGNFELLWPVDDWVDPIVGRTESLPDLSGKVDFFAASKHGSPVAVLVVGPYATPQMYAERAVDWCLRALGLRALHRRVALVLPEHSYAAAYVRFLDGIPNDAAKHLMIVRDMLPLGEKPRRARQVRR
jgi:hypothetical protein